MKKRVAMVLASMAAWAGCVGAIEDGGLTSSGGAGSSGSLTGGASASGSGTGTAGTSGSDLPCDVAALLSSKCTACHGTHPLAGVPMSLVTYADLTAPAKSDATRTNAVVAVARMSDPTSPMTPVGSLAATAAEIAALQSWISAGYPMTGCGTGVGPDPFAVPPTCTSNTTWTGGNNGSSSMDPGMACISCHATTGGEAPRFAIAGTVYPTAHEPDLCNGANGTNGARVVITGANGASITLTPNAAGNFSYVGTVVAPFLAKVTYMGRERIMAAAQTSGDCNSCHTQQGAMSAPGRILLP